MNIVSHKINFYLTIIRFKFIKALQWRTEMILWILLDIFPFIILLLVWRSVLAISAVNNISLAELTVFYFLVILIQGFTSTHFEEYRPEEIRMGKIDFFLTKPYNYIHEIVINDVAGKLLYMIFFSPLLFTLGLILWRLKLLTLARISGSEIIMFICLLFFAYLMQLCFSILITLAAFWFEEANGLTHFKWLFVSLFSGTLIPFPLLPEWLQRITNFLPLKFLYAVPIRVIQEQVLPTTSDWLVLFTTIVILFMSIFFLWRRGVQKYSSAGG